MSVRNSIDRAEIVESAIALIRDSGWESVSARSLAARLGTSTMPIYSAVGSMEELRQCSFLRASMLLAEAQRKPRTGNATLDLAVGYVAFAQSEPRLFEFITLSQKDIGGKLLEAAANPSSIGSIADLEALRTVLAGLAAPGRREDFVLRSWIFTHGLAQLIAEGTLEMDESEITRHLQDAGGAFYLYERRKEGLA